MFYTDARESFESRCYLSNMFIVWTIFIFLRCEQSWRKIFYYLSTSLNNFFLWNSFFSIRAIAKIRKQNLKFDLSNIGISASNKFPLGHSRCGMCFVCRILFRKPLLRRLRVYQVAFFIRFFGFFDLFFILCVVVSLRLTASAMWYATRYYKSYLPTRSNSAWQPNSWRRRRVKRGALTLQRNNTNNNKPIS